jgi:hypothetical protein
MSKSELSSTDGHSASLSWHQGPATNFSFPSTEIISIQLRVCYYGAASLKRRLICNLQFLLGLASAVFLGFESRWNHDHIVLSQF